MKALCDVGGLVVDLTTGTVVGTESLVWVDSDSPAGREITKLLEEGGSDRAIIDAAGDGFDLWVNDEPFELGH